MALIKCPECGKDVSDKAESCPNCGFPIESSSGKVKIILPVFRREENQKVTISKTGNVGNFIWEGVAGDVAEVYLEGAIDLTIIYHSFIPYFRYECSGVIDPSQSKRYTLSLHIGFISNKLVLQPC